MTGAETNGRISVSEDKLRTMLAEFKLDLFSELQKYATLVALAAVEKRLDDIRTVSDARIASLELWRASQEGGQTQGRRFSASAVAWGTLAVGLLAAVATLIVLRHGPG